MMVLRAMRERWSEWNEAERREEDEREQWLRLLAFRDAFIATVALLAGLLAAQLFLPGDFRDGSGAAATLALTPLAVITAAGLVWLISYRLRGGGVDQRVAMLCAAKLAGGLVTGYAIVAVLAWAGVVPLEIEVWPLLGAAAVGIAAAALLLLLVLRTGDREL